MQKILHLHKKEGETPLERIEKFKIENPSYLGKKMTYAGRLDPMAEGDLLVLVDSECKNKDKYLCLNKEYEFEVLWGFETDTFDILGLPVWRRDNNIEGFDEKLDILISGMIGKIELSYPAYSSMTVSGKQLFEWARSNRLNEIQIPKREVEIYKFEKEGVYSLSKEELRENIKRRVSKVKGDFRQEEILESWDKLLDKISVDNFAVSKFRIACSSGTYVRSIVSDLGKKLGTGAIAFKIKRTKIF